MLPVADREAFIPRQGLLPSAASLTQHMTYFWVYGGKMPPVLYLKYQEVCDGPAAAEGPVFCRGIPAAVAFAASTLRKRSCRGGTSCSVLEFPAPGGEAPITVKEGLGPAAGADIAGWKTGIQTRVANLAKCLQKGRRDDHEGGI